MPRSCSDGSVQAELWWYEIVDPESWTAVAQIAVPTFAVARRRCAAKELHLDVASAFVRDADSHFMKPWPLGGA